MESELEILDVQRTPGKPTMALMGEIGTRQYVGSAFVTFGVRQAICSRGWSRQASGHHRELQQASLARRSRS